MRHRVFYSGEKESIRLNPSSTLGDLLPSYFSSSSSSSTSSSSALVESLPSNAHNESITNTNSNSNSHSQDQLSASTDHVSSGMMDPKSESNKIEKTTDKTKAKLEIESKSNAVVPTNPLPIIIVIKYSK